jgi:hypothetical protein
MKSSLLLLFACLPFDFVFFCAVFGTFIVGFVFMIRFFRFLVGSLAQYQLFPGKV